ncbi:MAG: hypothetical protein OXF04_04495 [bacterium]|nr:hypothetical protein [bacterium]
MEVLTLGDLAPVLAAVIGPMVVMMFAMMRYQHVDSVKTRDLMHNLIEQSRQESRELIEKSHSELASGLGEVRERLAYIEGYLRQSPPPPPEGDAQAA